MKIKHAIATISKGVMMGVAESLPGISGGTMAVVLGIYQQLITIITDWVAVLQSFLTKKNKNLWLPKLHLPFLVLFLPSMALSIYFMSWAIKWLEDYKNILTIFFSGLITATAINMIHTFLINTAPANKSMGGQQNMPTKIFLLALFCSGIICAGFMLLIDEATLETVLDANGFVLFLLGVCSATLMMIPGVSGSFFLLVTGYYFIIFEAVRTVNITILLPYALGLAVALPAIAVILKVLLDRYKLQFTAFIAGLLIGSVYVLVSRISMDIWAWFIPSILVFLFGAIIYYSKQYLGYALLVCLSLAMLLPFSNLAPAQNQQQNYDEIGKYVVRSGDSLTSVAKAFKMPYTTLLERNPALDPKTLLLPGEHIYILGKNALQYTVNPGENLAIIAKRGNVSIGYIICVNDLKSPYVIYPNQILRLLPPADKVECSKLLDYALATNKTEQTKKKTPPPKVYDAEYTVKSGDTLFGIARKLDISIGDLMKNNQLSSANIYPGQVLTVKTYSDQLKYHIVQSGDSLWRIAANYKVSIKELAALNNLKQPYQIRKGEKLQLPLGSQSERQAESENCIDNQSPLSWTLPMAGEVTQTFTQSSSQSIKGIEIVSTTQNIAKSVEAGKVSYVGQGLAKLGYETIVILRHANNFLSIYAKGTNALVEQGQCVNQGDEIMAVGDDGKLLFVMRQKGKDIDPTIYLSF